MNCKKCDPICINDMISMNINKTLIATHYPNVFYTWVSEEKKWINGLDMDFYYVKLDV